MDDFWRYLQPKLMPKLDSRDATRSPEVTEFVGLLLLILDILDILDCHPQIVTSIYHHARIININPTFATTNIYPTVTHKYLIHIHIFGMI